ncbi:DUF1259 domain-containing protein [Paenibacillus antri]|uniref:DUF1259 domain-containing protein n=2 Tax=Paenibacillus antri TaxID=2582848 RepID=A0A5R9G7Y9_9BACL|nr:DUF1259 domain-containing protein [Paenibacillus antri]
MESSNVTAQAHEINWKPVEQILGIPGKMTADGVYKFSLPRSDLQVTVEGIKIKPTLALGTWFAFKKHDAKAMVMGDLVLTEDEVNPVMDKLFKGGIIVTALHNHLIGESPRVKYMHIEGHGEPVELAKSLREALDVTKTPLTASKSNQSIEFPFHAKRIEQVLGYRGQVSNGVYQISVPRAEKITENKMEIPPSMGVASPLNFQPTSGGKAAITGDLVLTAEEVYPVARVLRENDIKVTALHNHMLTEKPRLFFMHFWALDNAEKLAKGLRQALDHMNVK